tara:strand:- start:2828 stop:3211 length:384 start_codon:yes stop_codon:yes gene_type:complete
MKIKDIELNDLQSKCVDLLAKTYVELGQKSDSDTMITFAQILADDLKSDFETLDFIDIIQSFKIGVRTSDDYHLNVKTYYKWIRSHRQVLWDNEDLSDQQKDKRLKYRSKKGTGLKKLNINKNILSL